jgi:hypothetical protein
MVAVDDDMSVGRYLGRRTCHTLKGFWEASVCTMLSSYLLANGALFQQYTVVKLDRVGAGDASLRLLLEGYGR